MRKNIRSEQVHETSIFLSSIANKDRDQLLSAPLEIWRCQKNFIRKDLPNFFCMGNFCKQSRLKVS